MTHVTKGSESRTVRQVPARAWSLAVFAAVVGIVSGILAMFLSGMPRAVLAAAAFVFLLTAFLCIGFNSIESRSGPPFDPDEPPAEPPVPQTQVTLVYDPKEAPNNCLERDAAKPRRSG
jgi:hypothetical protein